MRGTMIQRCWENFSENAAFDSLTTLKDRFDEAFYDAEEDTLSVKHDSFSFADGSKSFAFDGSTINSNTSNMNANMRKPLKARPPVEKKGKRISGGIEKLPPVGLGQLNTTTLF
mmetsp:Transcript_25198/g.28819  ORF Transcript_25198/g.28819 Transcript_25198/m.28819 type:complete len:114 (+) Transcript_25198:252-593(+)